MISTWRTPASTAPHDALEQVVGQGPLHVDLAQGLGDRGGLGQADGHGQAALFALEHDHGRAAVAVDAQGPSRSSRCVGCPQASGSSRGARSESASPISECGLAAVIRIGTTRPAGTGACARKLTMRL